MATDIQQLKQGMKATWMAGDFGQIASFTASEAERFVQRLGLKASQSVLDVACGSGNLAIPAAKLGCVVTGVDIATNLVEQARARAAKEGVKAEFLEGDAEQLQFPDNSFDAVITMFGAMFAPRPELVARELVRVCKPGGSIAMANWTPAGFPGQLFRVTAQFVPPPPDVPPASQWGVPEIVKQRFGDAVTVETRPVTTDFDYPFPPEAVFEFFRRYFGPTQVAYSKLDSAKQPEFKEVLVKLWSEHNRAPNPAERTLVPVEYLEVKARKK
ncbi:MAG TPA: class I SAM-dependent methyltransferase [Terriglobales bacterium]|nr:class I SAM-dependent methyltransferase [Terriglobales bacterium]